MSSVFVDWGTSAPAWENNESVETRREDKHKKMRTVLVGRHDDG
jgi:hypothetical protein